MDGWLELGRGGATWDLLLRAGAPAMLLLACMATGVMVYGARGVALGPFRNEEAERRIGGGLAVRPVRLFFTWLMQPLVALLLRVGATPNAITWLSLVFSLSAGFFLGGGYFGAGAWLYLLSGMCDFLDGKIARGAGQTTRAGAALDSVLDRYSEAAVMLGLGWFYRGHWALLAVLGALSGSLLVSYVRARGEALGATLKEVGFMQRPERIVVLAAALMVSPAFEAVVEPGNPTPPHRLVAAALVLLAVVTHATAAHRLGHLVATLSSSADEPRRGQRAPRHASGPVPPSVAMRREAFLRQPPCPGAARRRRVTERTTSRASRHAARRGTL